MTIEMTVDIPASHRLSIDVPGEVPEGRVILTFTPSGEAITGKAKQAMLDSLAGICAENPVSLEDAKKERLARQ